MELTGTVLNVVDFGAFVDIGLNDSGLVHISQLANRYVRDPHDVVSVGDIVKVWVHEIDKTRRRVSLTMIAPASRRPAERVARRGVTNGVRSGDRRPPRPRTAGGAVAETAVVPIFRRRQQSARARRAAVRLIQPSSRPAPSQSPSRSSPLPRT